MFKLSKGNGNITSIKGCITFTIFLRINIIKKYKII